MNYSYFYLIFSTDSRTCHLWHSLRLCFFSVILLGSIEIQLVLTLLDAPLRESYVRLILLPTLDAWVYGKPARTTKSVSSSVLLSDYYPQLSEYARVMSTERTMQWYHRVSFLT